MASLKSDTILEFNKLVDEGDWTRINIFFINACYDASMEEIKYMIENGADPRYQEDMPLINACTQIPKEIVLYFINEHGANINAIDGRPLNAATRYGCIENMRILIDAGAKITDDIVETAFIFFYPDIEVIKILLEHGAPVTVTMIERAFGNYGYKQQDPNVIELMLQYGDPIKIAQVYVEKNKYISFELIKLFIKYGIDLYMLL